MATALLVLALGGGVAGCGKSGNSVGLEESRELNAAAPVASQGAAGQITRNTARLGGSEPIVDAAAVATAAHPGLSPASRPDAVVLVSAAPQEWPSALAASALAGAPLFAPLLYGEAHGLPTPSSEALAEMRPKGAAAIDGAQVLEVGVVATPAGYSARRLAGSDPYTFANSIEALVQSVHGAPPSQVIVVNAQGPPPFAMPAAELAAETGAPILLVESARVPVVTANVLRELKRPTIYAIGPTTAISEAVAKQLEGFGTVKRIAGPTPVENAIAVSSFSEGSFGFGVQGPGHGLVFANDGRPQDAAAAASLAATGDFGPLLLLEEANTVPPALSHYLENIVGAYNSQVPPAKSLYNHGWIIGGGRAISAATQADIDALLEIVPRNNPTPTPEISPP